MTLFIISQRECVFVFPLNSFSLLLSVTLESAMMNISFLVGLRTAVPVFIVSQSSYAMLALVITQPPFTIRVITITSEWMGW